MPKPIQPLGKEFPIVGKDGKPTEYFIRWAQQRSIEISDGITAAQAQQLIDDWAANRNVVAGVGLSGGGSLATDIGIDLDASLDDLNDVDFSTPPSSADVLTYNGTAWVPAAGTGGPVSAASVTNVPSGNISATNVQAAIDELDSEKVAKAGDTMSGNLTINTAGGGLTVQASSIPQFTVLPTGATFGGTQLWPARFNASAATPSNQVNSTGPGASLLVARYSNNVNSGRIYMVKTRGTTIGDFTASLTGDDLGAICFNGSDGTIAADSSRILATQIGPSVAGFAAGALSFLVSDGTATNLIPKLTVTAAAITSTVPVFVDNTSGATELNVRSQSAIATVQIQRTSTDATSPNLRLRKARGTIAVPTVVAANDTLGAIAVQAYDGVSAFQTVSQQQTTILEPTPSATAFGGRWSLNVASLGPASALQEILRVESAVGLSMYGANPVIDQNRVFRPRSYTLGTLPTITTTGIIHTSDLGGSPGPMASDGTQWRRLLPGGATNTTNADFTLTVRTDADNILHTGVLTANRTVTLSTTGVRPGDEFLITRTGGGAFSLNVGTGPLVSLTTGTWATVKVNAAGAWYLAACGPLSVTGGGGGGSGALTLISEVTTSGSAASVNFTSIASAYRDLELRVRARGLTAAVNVNVRIQFNGDTTGNYDQELIHSFDTGTNFTQQVGQVSGIIGSMAAGSAPAGRVGVLDTVIGDYRGTTFSKQCVTKWGTTIGTGAFGVGAGLYSTNWRPTTAITSVLIFPETGGFADGSVVSLYGRM